MSRPDEQPVAKLSMGDVASLLGVTVNSLPTDEQQLATVVEADGRVYREKRRGVDRAARVSNFGSMGDDAELGDIASL